jgi:hypothetical protein
MQKSKSFCSEKYENTSNKYVTPENPLKLLKLPGFFELGTVKYGTSDQMTR